MTHPEEVALESNKAITPGRMVKNKNTGWHSSLYWRYRPDWGGMLMLSAQHREVGGTRKRPFVVKLAAGMHGIPASTAAQLQNRRLAPCGIKLGSWVFADVEDAELRFHQIMLAIIVHVPIAPAPLISAPSIHI